MEITKAEVVMLAFLTLFITLIVPAILWVYYAFKTERGIFYLIYGLVTYLGLQMILRVSSLQILQFLPGIDTSALAVFVIALITVILAVGGITLIFFVFYKKKMEPDKAVGFGFGYSLFEPMLLFGVNTFLSMVLNMPMESSSYWGAIFETFYTVASTFTMILFVAMDVKEERIRQILWIGLLYLGLMLFNSLIFNIWPVTEWVRYLLLVLSGLIWLGLWFTNRFRTFYGEYAKTLFPFLARKTK